MNGGLCFLYKGLGYVISFCKWLEDFCEDNIEKNVFMCCVGKFLYLWFKCFSIFFLNVLDINLKLRCDIKKWRLGGIVKKMLYFKIVGIFKKIVVDSWCNGFWWYWYMVVIDKISVFKIF